MKNIKIKSSRKELNKKLRLYEFQNFVLYRTLIENIKQTLPDTEDTEKEKVAAEKARELIRKVENSIMVIRNDSKESR